MTRFNITLDQGVDMVLWAMQNMLGGEIFVPKIPSYRILDVAEAVLSVRNLLWYPARGETPRGDDHPLRRPVNNDIGGYYAITPSTATESMEKFLAHHSGKPVPEDFHYSSDNNNQFLSISEINQLIRSEGL